MPKEQNAKGLTRGALNSLNSIPFLSVQEDGIDLRVKVVPGSSRDQIVGLLGDRLKIKVAAPAESGKANKAVIRLITDWLTEDSSNFGSVEISSGHTAPAKIVRVSTAKEKGLISLQLLMEEKFRTLMEETTK